MYVNKLIINKVINLFTEQPNLRDNRWGTIKLVVEYLKKEFQQFDEELVIKYAFDADRAFRYVQQHIPYLRGDTWLKRQMMSGNLNKDKFDGSDTEIEIMVIKYKQGKLF